ncbi:Mitochondrial fission process protein 1 [Blattella germanica]|nr:Mitochondrial fission process protein 1 [Blattella germanica]
MNALVIGQNFLAEKCCKCECIPELEFEGFKDCDCEFLFNQLIQYLSMDNQEKDIYRDTPVRLLGYANEVGEAFRSLVNVNWVRLSYGIACAYVCADTYDKTKKMSKQVALAEKSDNKRVVFAAVDTLIWQSFASVIIPGFTINRLCKLSLYILDRTSKLPPTTQKWITTGIGLGCIPFIVKPIDTFVDYAMDETFRKFVKNPGL